MCFERGVHEFVVVLSDVAVFPEVRFVLLPSVGTDDPHVVGQRGGHGQHEFRHDVRRPHHLEGIRRGEPEGVVVDGPDPDDPVGEFVHVPLETLKASPTSAVPEITGATVLTGYKGGSPDVLLKPLLDNFDLNGDFKDMTVFYNTLRPLSNVFLK